MCLRLNTQQLRALCLLNPSIAYLYIRSAEYEEWVMECISTLPPVLSSFDVIGKLLQKGKAKEESDGWAAILPVFISNSISHLQNLRGQEDNVRWEDEYETGGRHVRPPDICHAMITNNDTVMSILPLPPLAILLEPRQSGTYYRDDAFQFGEFALRRGEQSVSGIVRAWGLSRHYSVYVSIGQSTRLQNHQDGLPKVLKNLILLRFSARRLCAASALALWSISRFPSTLPT